MLFNHLITRLALAQPTLSKPNLCRTSFFRNFYFNRVVLIWNNLPSTFKSSLTFSSLKSILYHYYLDFDVNRPRTWTTSYPWPLRGSEARVWEAKALVNTGHVYPKYWTFRNNLVFNPGGTEPIDFVKHGIGSAKARRFRLVLVTYHSV
jgi:hypothetical protein